MEEAGEASGTLRVVDIIRRSNFDREEILFWIGDGLDEHLKESARIVFTGKLADDVTPSRRRVNTEQLDNPKHNQADKYLFNWETVYTKTLRAALEQSDLAH